MIIEFRELGQILLVSICQCVVYKYQHKHTSDPSDDMLVCVGLCMCSFRILKLSY